ncbi:MAG: cytochrome c-550 PedF [Gammaproteobacteria bacterium]|nr:MAG: cytochrome c-550 PedF [Gammaproteobacteria bacterium]
MKNFNNKISSVVCICLISIFSVLVFAHGNVQPQAIDITGLDELGDDWLERNPYVGNELAIEIGEAAYGQNCARCHGLQGISGGINPDLRKMKHNAEDDAWFVMRVRKGAVRNGITYMPVFAETDGGPFSQEALWAIWAWIETIKIEK